MVEGSGGVAELFILHDFINKHSKGLPDIAEFRIMQDRIREGLLNH